MHKIFIALITALSASILCSTRTLASPADTEKPAIAQQIDTTQADINTSITTPKTSRTNNNTRVKTSSSAPREEETSIWEIIFSIFGITWLISLPVMGILYFMEYRRKWEDLPCDEQKVWSRESTRPEFEDLHSLFDNRKEFSLQPEDGNEVIVKKLFSSRQEVVAGYKELHLLKHLPSLNPDEIACLNEYGQELNYAQQRELSSSEKVLTAVVVLCILFCVLTFSLRGLIFIPVFAASYMMPNYMRCNSMPWFMALANFLVKIATFSSTALVTGILTAPITTTVTRWFVVRENGSTSSWTTEDLPMDSILFKAMAILMICVGIFISPIVIVIFSALGFIRNYLMSK